MRGFPLNIGCLGRIFGFIAVIALLIAAALHTHTDAIRPPSRPGTSASMPDSPLARELQRCQSIGTAAKNDTRCEAAWAENRRRFFTYRPAAAHTSAAGKLPKE